MMQFPSPADNSVESLRAAFQQMAEMFSKRIDGASKAASPQGIAGVQSAAPSQTQPGGNVPLTRALSTDLPLRIDGGLTADLTRDRKFTIDTATTGAPGAVQLTDSFISGTGATASMAASGKAVANGLSYRSVGVAAMPSLTDLGTGSVTVGSGTYQVCSSLSAPSQVQSFTLAGGTFALTDQALNYIYVDYNGGSPAVKWTTTRTDISDTMLVTASPIFTIFRDGTTLHYLDWDNSAIGLPEKMLLRTINSERFKREGDGLILADEGSLHFGISSGWVWYGVHRKALSAFSSSVDTVRKCIWNGSAWTYTLVSTYDNTHYQGASGLVLLSTSHKYAKNWIFRSIDDAKEAYIVMGTGDDSFFEAQASPLPTLPPLVSATAILVGSIVVQNGQSTPTVSSAFSDTFLLTSEDWMKFQTKAPLSTGLVYGGTLSINADNHYFDIGELVAFFADYTDPVDVVGKFITHDASAHISIPNMATENVTYIGVNVSGTIVQSSSPFTRVQRRSIVELGAVVHSNRTTINAVNSIAATTREVAAQVHDIIEALGPLNMVGNVYSANGTNLNINRSNGSLFKFGSNFWNSVDDPHGVSITGGSAMNLRYRLSGGTEYADTTSIDPDFYELAGVRTALSPSLPWQVQRINMFSSGLTRIQYGQAAYKDLATAVANYQTETFTTETNIAENGILRCFLVVKKGAANLSNPAEAMFIPVSKFGAPSSGGGVVSYDAVVAALGYVPEPTAVNLSSIAALPNAPGYLYNDGGGTFSYKTPAHNDLTGRTAADCHPATAITNTPAGNIAATTVQAAINELDSEKAALSGATFSGSGITTPSLTDSGLTSGRLVVAGVAGLLTDSTNLTYDIGASILSLTGKLGIGTVSPATSLDVRGTTASNMITTDCGINFVQTASPTSGTTTPVSNTGLLSIGTYIYLVTFTTALGETTAYQLPSMTTDATHLQGFIGIPVSSDPRVTGRKLYRTKVGGANFQSYALATIANNTDTTYTDNTPDSALTVLGGFYQANTTNNLIQVGGVRVFFASGETTNLGYEAGNAITAAAFNLFAGAFSGASTTTGSYNTFAGDSSGYLNVSGGSNVFSGFQSAYNIVSGNNNIAIGRQALSTANGASSNNTVIGTFAMYAGTAGAMSNNTAIGYAAGRANNGSNNIFLGFDSGRYETGSGKLMINAYDRSNEAGDRAGSIIYGVMSATVANQTLTLNAAVTVSNTTASTSSSSGALIVSGGLGVVGNIVSDGTMTVNKAIFTGGVVENVSCNGNALGFNRQVWDGTIYNTGYHALQFTHNGSATSSSDSLNLEAYSPSGSLLGVVAKFYSNNSLSIGVLRTSDRVVIGSGSYSGDASLHILGSFGGFGRIMQLESTANGSDAVVIISSKTSVGVNQWWSFGVNQSDQFMITSSTGIAIDPRLSVSDTSTTLYQTTVSTSTTTGALVVAGGVASGDYFTGKYRSSDGTAGLSTTKTFYTASSSGGAVNVLNTVTTKDGVVTSWTQA